MLSVTKMLNPARDYDNVISKLKRTVSGNRRKYGFLKRWTAVVENNHCYLT